MQHSEWIGRNNQNRSLLNHLNEQDCLEKCEVLDELDLYDNIELELSDLIQSMGAMPREFD